MSLPPTLNPKFRRLFLFLMKQKAQSMVLRIYRIYQGKSAKLSKWLTGFSKDISVRSTAHLNHGAVGNLNGRAINMYRA